VTATITWMLK